MRNIGIIGVGEIGRAMVMGLCDGTGRPPEVFLSPRGARTAAELSERYENVRVCADNQAVVDRSDIVIIAVRGQDRHDALAGLAVPDGTIVINVMSGVGNDDLRRTLATGAALVRAIPLPAIRERRSVTVTCRPPRRPRRAPGRRAAITGRRAAVRGDGSAVRGDGSAVRGVGRTGNTT